MKIAIIGGGIAGCSISKLFKDNGDDVTIFEKTDKIGGACQDYWDKKGMCWVNKYGPKILHFRFETEEARRFLRLNTSLVPYDHKVMVLGNSGFTFWPPCKAYKQLHNLLDTKNSFFDTYISSYSKKMWGKRWNSIKNNVLKRFKIKTNYSTDFFENQWSYLPENGYTNMFKELADGIPIKYNYDSSKLDFNEYKIVIWTAPIDEICEHKFGELNWQGLNFTFETIKTNGENLLPTPVVNLNTHPIFTRITEYQQLNVSPRINGTNRIIGFETPSKNNKLYPINNVKNTKLLEKYQKYAAKIFPNVYFLGRGGNYKYADMDQSVQCALDLFKKIK